jgi:hypothetical protein
VVVAVAVRFFWVMFQRRRDVMERVRMLVRRRGAEQQALLEVFDLWA